MNRLLTLLATVAAAPAVLAQTDDCVDPTPVSSLASYAFDSISATTSGFNGTGTCASGSSTINQDLFWAFTAPAAGNYRFDTFGTSFDTKLSVHAGTDCSAVCLAYNDDAVGLQSRVEVLDVMAGDHLLIQVGAFLAQGGTGVLNVSTFLGCGGVPDALEDNDTCPAPQPITAGTYTDLSVTASDLDFYSIEVGADEILSVAFLSSSPARPFGRRYDSSCTVVQESFAGLVYSNETGSPETVVFEAQHVDTSAACSPYTMVVTVDEDPCAARDDAFEDNDDCATALPLGDGDFPDLFISDSDNDFFALDVADGGTVDVSIFFTHAAADLDVYLWDPAVSCDTNVAGTSVAAGWLARGFSATDDEFITYTNTTGADQSLILEVDVFTAGPACNTYRLMISGAQPLEPMIGTPFCMANPNSTGLPGLCTANGSTSAAANDVTLRASQVPAGQFGIFVVAESAGAMTPVNEGILCLTGAIGRIQFAGAIWQADTNGRAAVQIDLTAIPRPTDPVTMPTMPGDTWFFQAWHRDFNGAQTSNFTSGVEIQFN